MKRIPLSKGAFALVDNEDYVQLSRDKWHLSSQGYAYRTVWFGRQYRPRHRHIPMHRQILGMVNSPLEVDHRNEDRLDNRRSNLRPALHRENASNRGKTRSNSSGFKGVTKHPGKYCKGWIAQIRVNGINRYLGYFPTPDLAAAAYDKAAIHHFKEFAQINGV